MDVRDILRKIIGKANSEEYLARFERKYDELSELFIRPLDVEQITDSPILLLLDEKPHSLISIAYALRFALDLKTTIYVIAEGNHAQILRDEATELGITLEFVIVKEDYTFEDVETKIDIIDIGFIITNIRHPLIDSLMENSPIPLFITKIE